MGVGDKSDNMERALAYNTPSPGNIPITHSTTCLSKERNVKVAAVLLRILALGLTIAAAISMATAKEVSSTTLYLPSLGQDIKIVHESKYTDIKAFIYHVYINGIVAGYTLVLATVALCSLLSRLGEEMTLPAAWCMFLFDQVFAYVLLASVGACAEVGNIAKTGINSVGWNEHCSNYGKYCNQVGASVTLSLVAVGVVGCSGAISAFQLFRRFGPVHPTPNSKEFGVPL